MQEKADSWHSQREFKYMFIQDCRANHPHIPIAKVFDDWSSIANGLAEPVRKRRP